MVEVQLLSNIFIIHITSIDSLSRGLRSEMQHCMKSLVNGHYGLRVVGGIHDMFV